MTLMPVVRTSRRGRLVHELGRRAMDRIIFLCLDRPAFVNRVAAHIEYPAHHPVPDGHGNGRAGVDDFVAAFETIGVGHGDGPDPVVTEVLLHFEGQFDRLVLSHKFDCQRVVDGRQVFREFDIHDRTDELNNFAFIHFATFRYSLPSWPPAISSSSLVILPCRSLLYSRVKSLIRPLALSVAFFMATMRALCSLALASNKTR